MNSFIILTSQGKLYIELDTIIRVEASSNYSKIYFINGKTVVVAKVLRWFEQTLPTEKFVRIHRTHMVNKKFISDYISASMRPLQGGKICLKNGEILEVSKRKKSCFLKSWHDSTA